MAYRYLDIMKQVLPDGEINPAFFNNIQFRIFGTYDALYVGDVAVTISQMKSAHENRHATDWQLERQPLFVYYPDQSEEIVERILNHNTKKDFPLALILIQLDKNDLKESNELLSIILERYQKTINDTLHGRNTEAVACWNLSGSDLLIFARAEKLQDVADVINILYGGTDSANKGMYHVFSTSSHCAIVSGTPQEMVQNVETWLKRDVGIKLQTYFETANGYDRILQDHTEMILGERDYRLAPDKDGSGARDMKYVFEHQDKDKEGKYSFRSSYIIPIIPVMPQNRSANLTQKHYLTNDGDIVSSKLEEIIHLIKTRPDHSWEGKAYEIEHARNTLQGLLKYAYRLEASIHQYDLFHRIKKCYDMIGVILDLYLAKARNNSIIGREIDELEKSLMYFVTDLQHLITILALSPHTYMETYSCSMRSLNAGAKLWDAYNGVIETMKEIFHTRVLDRDQNCEVLLSPYRGRISMNRLLFKKVSENNTLIILQMNFRLMFENKQALFMLTHEMGHHLGPQIREMRSHCMTKAVAAAMMRFAIPSIQMPMWQIVKPVANPIELDKKYLKLATAAYFNGDSVSDTIKQKLLLIPTENLVDAKKQYEIYESITNKLREKIYDIFQVELEIIEREFSEKYEIGASRSWKKDAYFSEEMTSAYRLYLSKIVREHSQKIWQDIQAEIIDVLEYECDELDSFRIAQLKGEWKFWRIRMNLDEKYYKSIEKILEEGVIQIYREVHADIMAIKTLGIDQNAGDYFEFIASETDVYPPILEAQTNVCRIFLIYHVIYCEGINDRLSIRESAREMARWIRMQTQFSDDTRDIALRHLYQFATSIRIIPMIDFAIECEKNIDVEILKLNNNEGLKHIQGWYQQEDMEHIHYFWKQNLK